jgi:hypothetical protein
VIRVIKAVERKFEIWLDELAGWLLMQVLIGPSILLVLIALGAESCIVNTWLLADNAVILDVAVWYSL